MVVEQPQCIGSEGPTLLCNQVCFGTEFSATALVMREEFNDKAAPVRRSPLVAEYV